MYTCTCAQTCCIMMITLLFTQLGLVMLGHLSPVVVQLTAHILILVRCSELQSWGQWLCQVFTVTECDLLLCLGVHASKAYSSRFVCLSVCVTLISRQWLRIKRRRMQYNNNISYLIVLDFWTNASFSYLWCDLLMLNTVGACSRLPRRQIYSHQISLQLETWINTTGTAAGSRTMQ